MIIGGLTRDQISGLASADEGLLMQVSSTPNGLFDLSITAAPRATRVNTLDYIERAFEYVCAKAPSREAGDELLGLLTRFILSEAFDGCGGES